MLRFDQEIAQLVSRGLLPADRGEQVLRIERREIFSIWWPLRLIMLAGVSLVTGAAATWLASTPGDTVHVVGITTTLFASALCYWWAMRNERIVSTTGEIVLLLGALLLSTAVAWVEVRYHVLGDLWSLHLLLLAVIHAATAYRTGSRSVMTLAILSLAGWWGVDRRGEFLSAGENEAGGRLLAAAASIGLWGLADFRMRHASRFSPYFRAFAFNLAFIGSICWIASDELRWVGVILLAILASVAIFRARDRGRDEELFYAAVYGAIGLDVLAVVVIASEWSVVWIAVTSLALVGFTIAFLAGRRSR